MSGQELFLKGLMCLVGESAFAVLMGTSRKHCFACGVVGTIGYLCYCVLAKNLGLDAMFSVAVGTVLILCCARILAVWRRVPATVFVVIGIFPLVPGTGIYYTAYYMMNNDGVNAALKGAETVKTALALAIGILIGNAIPQSWYNRLGALRRAKPGK